MRHSLRFLIATSAVVGLACAKSSSSGSSTMAIAPKSAEPAPNMSLTAPTPDPRVGLRAGTMMKWPKDTSKNVVDRPAAEAAWNMRLLSNTPASDNFRGVTNSDLAFRGKYAIQGNYNGYQVWDISNPEKPVLATAFFCPASQSDVSVHRNLLFVSSEATSGRTDCATGAQEEVSAVRMRGIRVFDAPDITKPKYLTNVQSCRGSHTHTVVDDPKDPSNVYIYISGTSTVRPEAELKGCLSVPNDPNTACFRLEVIQVPVAKPGDAKIVNTSRIFQNLPANAPNNARRAQDSVEQAAAAAARGGAGGGRGGRGGAGGAAGRGGAPGGGGRCGGEGQPPGPNQCHDITVYPAMGLAGGACAGLGLLLDIRDPANPKRLSFVADSNFSFWHSATFSNDASKILFTDEWGGGGAPKCRASDKMEWGADALFTLANNQMTFKSYYKMPAAQTAQENCVAHNGSLIPIPGREVMVQSWYQGGVSVFDWTDISHPKEIAYFDRGPLSGDRMVSGGSWSAYWYNGVIVSSEIARGLDIFELLPSGLISKNELDAAKTVHYEELNVQDQPKMVWPPSFALSRAYLDQLARSGG
ncbi:MAG TPA: hypothetical protein VE967_05245, partial [Gemmatimonadaceae bacterium]|nr:hypothetical protein [Gemmatimonadaceae bacterium]